MRAYRAVVAVLLAAGLAGCASGADAPQGESSATPPEEQTLTVFAAASLTETFEELGERFEAEHPGVTVTFNFGGSSALAQQILQGAPADVFAAASGSTMQTAIDGDAVEGDATVFATNSLQIAVPAGNPAGIGALADLADPARTIALCAPEVPCGAAAAAAFAAAGLTAAPDTLEQDVKAVLTKVELDEVDAGLVYRTDVIAADDAVDGIDFAEADATFTDYPIAVLRGASDGALARDFVEFVLGEGRPVLEAAGFAAP